MVAEAASGDGTHEVALTGLQPSTRYAYAIALQAGGQQSGEFTTARTTQPFSFLVYGATRTNDADHQSVVNAMKTQSVDFLIHTGDAVEYP